jgi:hypothetical protein
MEDVKTALGDLVEFSAKPQDILALGFIVSF